MSKRLHCSFFTARCIISLSGAQPDWKWSIAATMVTFLHGIMLACWYANLQNRYIHLFYLILSPAFSRRNTAQRVVLQSQTFRVSSCFLSWIKELYINYSQCFLLTSTPALSAQLHLLSITISHIMYRTQRIFGFNHKTKSNTYQSACTCAQT